MSWKEIKRIEEIFRKERGDDAIVIRLLRQDEKVSSVILSLENKNSRISIDLNIEEWNSIRSFFNLIDSKISLPSTPYAIKENEFLPEELEKEAFVETISEESTDFIAEAKIIAPISKKSLPTLTIIHDTTEATSKLKKPVSTSSFIHEPIEVSSEIKIDLTEPEEQISAPVIFPESTELPSEVENNIEPEKPSSPPAVVIEYFKPPSEVETKIPEPKEPFSMIPNISEPEELGSEVTEVPSKKEELYPPMPPEVKEIFEQLNNQASELEEPLILSEDELKETELSKEAKITNAMKEVAELMPLGPAKEFVEQMILKRQKKDKNLSESRN